MLKKTAITASKTQVSLSEILIIFLGEQLDDAFETLTFLSKAFKIVARIEDPLVIKRILELLDAKTESAASVNRLPE